jgi:hypothetical protein
MPHWFIQCLYCHGLILDALLECVPPRKQSEPAFKLLFNAKPGAALACPYCGKLLGFDENGQPLVPPPGWPVYRYGQAELEKKKVADGEPEAAPLTDWALRQRFIQPGELQPLHGYLYAEHAPADETVP